MEFEPIFPIGIIKMLNISIKPNIITNLEGHLSPFLISLSYHDFLCSFKCSLDLLMYLSYGLNTWVILGIVLSSDKPISNGSRMFTIDSIIRGYTSSFGDGVID